MALSFKKILIGTVGLSLAASAAVGLTLFLWPAALAAVASFSVYGLSIAGIVGANTALQIGFTAGLAFAATSVASSFAAALFNTASWIKNACFKPKAAKHGDHQFESPEVSPKDSINLMSQLGGTPASKSAKEDVQPTHTTPVHATPKTVQPEEPVVRTSLTM